MTIFPLSLRRFSFLALILFFAFGISHSASALVVRNYTCAGTDKIDTSFGVGSVCSGDELIFTGTGGVYSSTDLASGLTNFPYGSTWYVSFVASGSGAWRVLIDGNSISGSYESDTTSVVTDLPLVAPAMTNVWHTLMFRGTDGFIGNISDICITDTEGGCGGAPDPVYGCTDPEATNYDPLATVDDDSCTYPTDGGLVSGVYPSVMLFTAMLLYCMSLFGVLIVIAGICILVGVPIRWFIDSIKSIIKLS